ncbi:peptide deformylase [Clostridium oceanicum]|uniref:Peptide deformylase n=1 Tax=Clostridium oceanicum TaxID=1543 RepID=A0ABP3UKG6_9CLOT
MAVRTIRISGDEVLRKKCLPVGVVDDNIRKLLNDMAETLHSTENGAALAGPQVGILRRLVVIDMGTGIMKLVNPKIIKKEGTQTVIEGCLSIPDVWGKLERPSKVTIEALNENGEKMTLTGTKSLAKCFCHEIDHLDGILFTDLVTEYID